MFQKEGESIQVNHGLLLLKPINQAMLLVKVEEKSRAKEKEETFSRNEKENYFEIYCYGLRASELVNQMQIVSVEINDRVQMSFVCALRAACVCNYPDHSW